MQNNYENLANAIVLQATRDYRVALKCLRRNPNNKNVEIEADDIERFFHSQWYQALTSIDGEYLIKRLREEVVV